MARKNKNPKRRIDQASGNATAQVEPKRQRQGSSASVQSPSSGSESGKSILKDSKLGNASPKKNVKWDAKVIAAEGPVPSQVEKKELQSGPKEKKAPKHKAESSATTSEAKVEVPKFFGNAMETGEQMLQFLLGDVPVKKFFSEYWEKQPLIISRKNKVEIVVLSSTFTSPHGHQLFLRTTILSFSTKTYSWMSSSQRT